MACVACAIEGALPDSPNANRNVQRPNSSQSGHRRRPGSPAPPSGSVPSTWDQYIFLLVEDPQSSCAAKCTSFFVLFVIMASIAGFILQTEPALSKLHVLSFLEVGSTIIFTIEYLVRLLVCNSFKTCTRFQFLRMPMNVLDLFAILPFYVELALHNVSSIKSLKVLRAVRLIRCFRIFKLSKYSLGMNLMIESLAKSLGSLSVLSFFLCIGVVLFSALMYYAERFYCPDIGEMRRAMTLQTYFSECEDLGSGFDSKGQLCCDERGSANDFQSILMACWWSIVTMTTVGYGDRYPRTLLGKIVAFLAMLSGIVLISLPVAIVGTKFQQAYEEYEASVRSSTNEMLDPGPQPSQDDDESKLRVKLSADMMKAVGRLKALKKPGGQRAEQQWQDMNPADAARLTQLHTGFGSLTAKLTSLESCSEVSPAFRHQAQDIRELMEHIEKIEAQLVILKDQDAAQENIVHKSFIQIANIYSKKTKKAKKAI